MSDVAPIVLEAEEADGEGVVVVATAQPSSRHPGLGMVDIDLLIPDTPRQRKVPLAEWADRAVLALAGVCGEGGGPEARDEFRVCWYDVIQQRHYGQATTEQAALQALHAQAALQTVAGLSTPEHAAALAIHFEAAQAELAAREAAWTRTLSSWALTLGRLRDQCRAAQRHAEAEMAALREAREQLLRAGGQLLEWAQRVEEIVEEEYARSSREQRAVACAQLQGLQAVAERQLAAAPAPLALSTSSAAPHVVQFWRAGGRLLDVRVLSTLSQLAVRLVDGGAAAPPGPA